MILTGGGIYIVVDQIMYMDHIVGTSMVYDGALVVTIASGLAIGLSVLGCCSSRAKADRFLSGTVRNQPV